MNKEVPLFVAGQPAEPLQHFTRLLGTPYGYTKFHFNRIHTAEGVQYHISCKPVGKKSYALQMAPVLGHWHITPVIKCPMWIKVLEADFEKAITETQVR